jgi:PhnB protein
MSFDVFINFDGECAKALDFYAEVFQTGPARQVMRYGDAPGAAVAPADQDRILHASLPIFGVNVMFSDCPTGSPFVKGNNIALTLGTDDAAEIERLYDALRAGGSVHMALGKTFFSELYAMVVDRYGLTWQLSKTPI